MIKFEFTVSDADAENIMMCIQDSINNDNQKIMKEMIYPGQIKVTVIRERRAVAFAK